MLLRLRLLPNRLWIFLWERRCPLGARIYVYTEEKTPSGISAGYCAYGGKITLYQRGGENIDVILEILNHEILHAVLNKIAGLNAWNDLDNVNSFNTKGTKILFKGVENDEDIDSV